MKTILSKTVNIDNCSIHYLTAGQGEPLLLIHGYGGEAEKWINNIGVLAEKYTVYAPDLPGFGNSQPLTGTYYIPELAAFVESFVEHLGLTSFYLVGHSLGGGISLNYALRYPGRIKKLVLVSSLCLGKEIALWVRMLSRPARIIGAPVVTFYKIIKWLGKKIVIPFHLIEPISQSSIDLAAHVATYTQQSLILANRLSEIMVPTLLVWGAKDSLIPVEHAYTAVRQIPECRIKVFKDYGHNLYRDDVGQFSQALTAFLG